MLHPRKLPRAKFLACMDENVSDVGRTVLGELTPKQAKRVSVHTHGVLYLLDATITAAAKREVFRVWAHERPIPDSVWLCYLLQGLSAVEGLSSDRDVASNGLQRACRK